MPFVRGIEAAVPPHCIQQPVARAFAAEYFRSHLPGIDRLLPVFDHAGIERRYFSRPAQWFLEDWSFAEKNRVHLEAATELGARVARQLLTATGEDAASIDAVFVVNSTGIATPSLDVRLLFQLGLRPNVRRIPIWGLGCAGGVAGLAHAASYLEGRPHDRVLFISLELCGLTFLAGDRSRSNLVACALFGEGAAAVLVDGDARARDTSQKSGVRFLASGSTHYPDSLDVMGWHVVNEGLQVVFAQRIPDIVRREARAHFDGFLAGQGRSLVDVDHFLFHPGGVKVLQAYADVLEVDSCKWERSRSVLRNFGNMSSVTVLFVLAEHLALHAKASLGGTTKTALSSAGTVAVKDSSTASAGPPVRNSKDTDPPSAWYGATIGDSGKGTALLSALGPGFSSESLLLEIS